MTLTTTPTSTPTSTPKRTVTLNGIAYPVVLPNVRDSRLHVAAVIITIHVLGQFGLDFAVSVPQILASIATAAAIEVGLTFRARRSFVWPASAMLTGSGVALILRSPGTRPGDTWSTHDWYLFAGVAAVSVLSKYVIRHRGSHLFNPSNFGLVLAFVVLGSKHVEPLDFWWGPPSASLAIAYVVILVGGVVITTRLRLLGVAATFWLGLAAGVGLLAAAGHCMTARWAFGPVCGDDYWRVIVTSPEVLIFLFFMITDPKTIPTGRVGRLVFGMLVAIACTALMAPQTTEYRTKVALLGGLVVVCALRPLLDRVLPAAGSADDRVGVVAARVLVGRRGGVGWAVPRVAAIAAVFVAIGAGVVAAGSPDRDGLALQIDDVIGRLPQRIDPATFPTITVAPDVSDWNHEIEGDVARQLVLDLVENLALEREALLQRDASILPVVDHGDRLDEMQQRLAAASGGGETTVERYDIDAIDVTLLVPFGKQEGLSLGLVSRGSVTTETYGADGGLVDSSTTPLAATFAVRQVTGARWLNVGVLPSAS